MGFGGANGDGDTGVWFHWVLIASIGLAGWIGGWMYCTLQQHHGCSHLEKAFESFKLQLLAEFELSFHSNLLEHVTLLSQSICVSAADVPSFELFWGSLFQESSHGAE